MLRNLTKSDINQILAIEESVHISPWTEETFNTCFESGYIGWVIEIHSKIIGFIIVSMRMAECHILNICIAFPYQHKGYGRKLLEYALENAQKNGITMAYLEVRRSNAKAINLYKKLQFDLVGERKNYYPAYEGSEDALIFAKDLSQTNG